MCVAQSALDRANTNVLLKSVGWWQQFRISSRSFVKPMLSWKLTNTSEIEKSKSESETKLNKNMLSLLLALPPLPLPSSSSSASPLVLTLLLLDASHGDHPHHWVLVELTLAVH